MSLNKVNIRFTLAKLIINKLGKRFIGYEELKKLSEKDYNSNYILQYLAQTSLETLIDVREHAKKFSFEPRTIKHQLTQVYTGLISEALVKDNFSRTMIFILFILEVCQHFLVNNHSIEIKSIHEFSSRLLRGNENKI